MKITTLPISQLEILAAFRCSHLTASREGFPRKAAEVCHYLDMLEAAGKRIAIVVVED